jgi:subtilase family serine protease
MRAAVVGAVVVLGAASLAAPAVASSPHATAEPFSAIPDSLRTTTDVSIGAFHSAAMSVEVALAPSHEGQLQALLVSVYTPRSRSYAHWLQKGQFDSHFAPSRAEVSAVAKYLQASGLVLEHSSSPFLVRAVGSSAKVSMAFRTSLRVYRDAKGTRYFSNASAVQLPKSLVGGVLGVIGLSNTVRAHPMLQTTVTHSSSASARSTKNSASAPSCETGYPTRRQLFNYVNTYNVNNGTGVYPYGVYGYGGGPGCNGLTPQQTNSIYGAPNVGPRGKGAGVNLAVFELSAYNRSDISVWAHTFYGPHYTPPLVNINVDGGPLHPVCPTGDTCYPGYGGAGEVTGDIEMQLTISPDASHILVYNAPLDATGQTFLDEFTAIASQDIADVTSSSWNFGCESDVGAAYAQAENVVFEQMALQGEGMFQATGNTGAWNCIADGLGNDAVSVSDPASQPWVTGVGGTSFEQFNPGANPHPAYPTSVETVWNTENLCNESPNEGGAPGGASGYPLSGYTWCSLEGASGGGSSQFWGRPFYQQGPGVNNPYTTVGNGTTQCSLTADGTPCREVPDVSADADPYTAYALYGIDYSGATGWFDAGGTSAPTPLWSGIFADRDSFEGHRTGNANPLLYLLFNIAPKLYFHDITGIGQTTTSNGLFPTTPGYSEATGIGTPVMSALITGR